MPLNLTKLQKIVFSRIYVDLSGRVEDTILLAGIGRCGSTWLSEVINYNNEYRYIFEPFRPEKVPETRAFGRLPYLRPQRDDEALVKTTEAILSGRIRNRWVDSQNRKLIGRKRLVKTIRANLVLRWIHEHFPQVPVVLIFRHPCAVANSRLKVGMPAPIEDYLKQPRLMADHLEPFRDLMENTTNPFERHVLMWCIQYYVPLRQLEPGQIRLAFYEKLCENPEERLRKLFAFLGKPFEKKVLRKVSRPSAMTRRRSAIRRGGSAIRSWREDVTPEQVERAVEILSRFELDRIYGPDPMPHTETAHDLLRTWSDA